MSSRKLIQAIGVLESCFKEKFGAPRQPHLVPGATARLRVKKEFIPEQSLKGLEGFSHVWLLSYFHLNTNKTFKSTVHPPRLQGGTVGVFASRSPHRPSPIGLSLAKLETITGDTLHLSGIDLVDGTPILDIKPYIPICDSVRRARTGWTGRVKNRAFRVVWRAPAREALRRLGGGEAQRLERLVGEVLKQDPRNPRDRSQNAEGRALEMFLLDYDVHFRITDGRAEIFGLERAKEFKKARRPPPLPASL